MVFLYFVNLNYMSKKVLISVLLLVVAGLIVLAFYLSGEDLAGRIFRKSKILPAYNENVTYQCSDGVDNDGDGLADYPSDSGCSGKYDNNEKNVLVGCSGKKTIMSTMSADGLPSQEYYSGDDVLDYLQKTKNDSNSNCYLQIKYQSSPVNSDITGEVSKFIFLTNASRFESIIASGFGIPETSSKKINGLEGGTNTIYVYNDSIMYTDDWDNGTSQYENFIFRVLTVNAPSYEIFRMTPGSVSLSSLENPFKDSEFLGLGDNPMFPSKLLEEDDLLSTSCTESPQMIYPYTADYIFAWDTVKTYIDSLMDGDPACQLIISAMFNSYDPPYKSSSGFDIRLKIKDLTVNTSSKKVTYQYNNKESLTLDFSGSKPVLTANVFSENESGEGGLMYVKTKFFDLVSNPSL